MQCENSDGCPARINPTKRCWEIASDLEDYRKANNICRDCIVYVLEAEESVLSQQEIDTILAQKQSCKMVNKCQKLAALAFSQADTQEKYVD